MFTIKSIEEEKADCIAAWEAAPDATWAWCCYHEVLVEPLIEPWRNRLNYILSDKPEDERAVRFINFRPVRVVLPESLARAGLDYAIAAKRYFSAIERFANHRIRYEAARMGLAEQMEAYPFQVAILHSLDWPNNTWDGKSIFRTYQR